MKVLRIFIFLFNFCYNWKCVKYERLGKLFYKEVYSGIGSFSGGRGGWRGVRWLGRRLILLSLWLFFFILI